MTNEIFDKDNNITCPFCEKKFIPWADQQVTIKKIGWHTTPNGETHSKYLLLLIDKGVG